MSIVLCRLGYAGEIVGEQVHPRCGHIHINPLFTLKDHFCSAGYLDRAFGKSYSLQVRNDLRLHGDSDPPFCGCLLRDIRGVGFDLQVEQIIDVRKNRLQDNEQHQPHEQGPEDGCLQTQRLLLILLDSFDMGNNIILAAADHACSPSDKNPGNHKANSQKQRDGNRVLLHLCYTKGLAIVYVTAASTKSAG